MSRMLVVDDDPTIVAIYKNIFEKHGFDVEVARDGQTALDAYHRERPDIVLLDINIPQLSGIAWLQAVRHEPGAKVPVVVLTAGTTKAQVLSAWNVGASCVLLKSRDEPQRVLDVVQALTAGEGPKTWGH